MPDPGRGSFELAVTTPFLPLLGKVEDEIVECFRIGGGVPYESYRRFHEVMAEESDQTVIAALFDRILPIVPGLQRRLFRGIDVLDVGCGRGRAVMALAERHPRSRFVGRDLCPDAIEHAWSEASVRGIANASFEAYDLTNFRFPEQFDLVTAFDAIHDQKDPASVLRGVRAALRRDGVFLMQDIGVSSDLPRNMDEPLGPFTYTISCMHCMTVSLAQGGVGLGAAWGEELAHRMLQEAGFTGIEVHRLEHDVMNAYFVVRP